MKKGRPHRGSSPSFFIFFYFSGDTNQNWPSYREWPQISLGTIGFDIGPKLRPTDGPRGACDIEALNGASKVGASRDCSLNCYFLTDFDKN